MLGVHPFLGRDFDPPEEKAGAAPVVLLSYPLWQSHFGGDPKRVGRTIALDGRSFTIIGVLPPDFRWIEKTDVLEPIGVWATNNSPIQRARRSRRHGCARTTGAGHRVSRRPARKWKASRRGWHKAYPGSNDQFGVALRPIRDVFVSDIRPAILVLFGAVMFVLLIACANVANLFLMRGAGRTREIALRIAVGASRGRIIRQMLAESFVLAFLGGLLGLALAVAGIRGIARLIPADMLAGASVNLNGPVLLFAAGVVVLCAFIFGLAPAIALDQDRRAVGIERRRQKR